MSAFASSSSSRGGFQDLRVENACVKCLRKQDSVVNLTGERLLTNSLPACLHKFCNQCVEREFSTKRQFKCPVETCVSMVKRNTLISKTIDEHEVSEDAKIRKRIKAIYNKIESDFHDIKDFHDYEEEAEDIIYNLVHGIDVEEMQRKVDMYSSQHADLINENKARHDRHTKETSLKIIEEKQSREVLLQEVMKEEARLKMTKKQLRQQTNELMLGERERVTVDGGGGNGFSNFMGPSARTNSSSVNPPTNTMNPLLIFLQQRPEPKMLVTSADMEQKKLKEDKRALFKNKGYRLAGGFDERVLAQREWMEMISCLNFASKDDAMV